MPDLLGPVGGRQQAAPFWGHLSLTGKEFKTFRGAQVCWVVIQRIAHAARLAEALSWHGGRIVVNARPGTDPVIDAGLEIDSLIKTSLGTR